MRHPRFGNRFTTVVLLAVLLGSTPAWAQSEASRASANSSAGLSIATGSVVAGTASLIAASAVLTVKAVEKAGDSVVVVLKGASEATTVSVKVAASAVGTASLAVGSTVKVVAEASGYALYLAGKLIAFIPNEIGKSLMHHSEVKKAGEVK